MENIAFESQSDFVWGKPEGVDRPDGSFDFIFFLFSIIVLVVVVFLNSIDANDPSKQLYWFLRFAMVIAIFNIFKQLFSSHFVLDGVKANHSGLFVAYSHIPKPGGRFINEKILLGWNEITSIKVCQRPVDEDVHYYTIEMTNRSKAPGITSAFEFGNMTSVDAHRNSEIFRSFLPIK